MKTTRRDFVNTMVLIGTAFASGCADDGSFTTPAAPTVTTAAPAPNTAPAMIGTASRDATLLEIVREAGHASASSQSFGNNGAAKLLINGTDLWNFKVRGETVGIGGNGAPTLNVPAIRLNRGDGWAISPAA